LAQLAEWDRSATAVNARDAARPRASAEEVAARRGDHEHCF